MERKRLISWKARREKMTCEPGIKQMPKYDPDAELNGLRYTVSAWRNAIARTALQADLRRATPAGKNSLKAAGESTRVVRHPTAV